MSLQSLARQIQHCKKCPLHKKRKHAVPGEGPKNAKIMFVGQAPGRQEDKTGKPFVGRAGKFLNSLLKKKKIRRKKVFITSCVKCFPPQNRIPKKQELEACKPYLMEQIKLVNPKTIVLMGKIAQKTLEKNIKNKKIIKTHHPAAAMRFPKIRKIMEKDFERLAKTPSS